MTKDKAVELSGFLEHKVDDYLRSVIHYEDYDYSVVYIRDDVAEQYSEGEVEDIAKELFWDSFSTPHQESLYPHGGLQCTIRCIESAVKMYFPHSERAGTAVAMEAQAAEELYSFVGDCLTVIGSEESV